MNTSQPKTSYLLAISLLIGVSIPNSAIAQNTQTTAPKAEQALNTIISSLHEHLKAWENTSTLEMAKISDKLTLSQINVINDAIKKLKKQPPKTEKAKQELSELLEANLTLINKRWDVIEKKLKANNAVYSRYQKASSLINARLHKLSVTIYETLSPTSQQAK